MEVSITINGEKKSIPAGILSVNFLYETVECDGEQIFLSLEDDIDIPLLPEEHLVIHGGEEFVVGKSNTEDNPPLRKGVHFSFNGSDFALGKAKITGKALKKHDKEIPDGRLFIDIEGGVDVEISDDMTMILQNKDSYFIIPPPDSDDLDLIDIEECGKHERRPPKGKSYRIRIDGDKYRVGSEKITGTAILELVGKNFQEWSLNQKFCGGKREKIKADDTVDLIRPGVERFETVRRQAQQGDAAYELPEEDVEYLNAHYPSQWKKISEGNGKYGLIIENFSLPGGYTVEKSTLMLLVPSGYPGSGLDMFYFDPPLNRLDGGGIGALATETHFVRQWQRWSRHYQWNPGEDSLVKHIEYVINQLQREVS